MLSAAHQSSQPLYRQIDALTAQLATMQAAAADAELMSRAQLKQAEETARAAQAAERAAVARATAAEAAIAATKERAAKAAQVRAASTPWTECGSCHKLSCSCLETTVIGCDPVSKGYCSCCQQACALARF